MIKLIKKDKEVQIELEYEETLRDARVSITGRGDMAHHLIEGLIDLVNRLARMERVPHEVKDTDD